MFILNSTKLRAGDILLTAQDALVSKAVRKLTKSSFSHAMLCVADSSYIHSDADGVHAGNPGRMLFADQASAVVLRLKIANPSSIEKACMFARTQVGKQYSVPEAVKSKFRRSSDADDESNRQFCSRLVAQAYAFAGVALVPNPAYCYPSDFLVSPLLEQVQGISRLAKEEEIEFAESSNPLDQQTVSTNYIFQQLRTLAKNDIQTFQQLSDWLIQHPEHDDPVCSIVKKSGYLDLWSTDVERNPWRYDAAIFVEIQKDDLRTISDRELKIAKKQMTEYKFMHGQYLLFWRQKQLRYFAIQIQLYMTLVDLTKKRIDAANHGIALCVT